jgi:hypothetical protein
VVDRVTGEATFTDIDALKGVEISDTSLHPDAEALLLSTGGVAPESWRLSQVTESLRYPVELISRGSPSAASAIYISSPQEMAWLKRLIYALPETALEEYTMAVTDLGCVVVHRQGVEFLPIGTQLREAFPNVFIPIGSKFSPPLSYKHLQSHLGLKPDRCYFMPRGLTPAFSLGETDLRPVAQHLLAEIDMSEATTLHPEPLALHQAVELVNEDIGFFALWGHNLGAVTLGEGSVNQPLQALPAPDPGPE